jgi:hypothetical protein
VEFIVRCEDQEGLWDTSPETLCEDLVDPVDPDREPPRGPCDRELGGPGCWRDEWDLACHDGDPDEREDDEDDWEEGNAVVGLRYIECNRWFRYVSGYETPDPLQNLKISEVVASQGLVGAGGRIEGVLEDPSESDWTCDVDNPTCRYDDFIELYNSSTESIDLSGLWLSNSRFKPEAWPFPPGSRIEGGEFLIVWLDGDGGRCPCSGPDTQPLDAPFCSPEVRPDQQPCFWECPDPTDPCRGEFHTPFTIDADRDQVYLYDTEERSFGLIHGVEFGDPGLFPEGIPTNRSLSLVADGGPEGTWQLTQEPTPGCPNAGPCPTPPNRRFYRGDANSDCGLDIVDGVYILNHLFLGGPGPTCMDAADTDDSGTVNLSDAVYVLGYLFWGTTAPPPPQPPALNPDGPAADPTCDNLPRCEAPLCQ